MTAVALKKKRTDGQPGKGKSWQPEYVMGEEEGRRVI